MFNRLSNNLISRTFRDLRTILDSRQKKKGVVLIFFIIIGAFLDVLGLAAILPVISIALDNTIISTNKYLFSLYNTFGFANEDHFLLALIVALLFVFIVKNAIAFFINIAQALYSSSIATSLSQKQFQKYFSMDYYTVKEMKSSKLQTYISSIPNFFSTSLLMPFILLLSEIMVIAITLTGIAIINLTLLLMLSALLFPTFFILYRATKNKMYRIGLKRRRFGPKVIKEITQAIFGYVEVKLFGKEKYFMESYLYLQGKLNRLNAYSFILNYLPGKIVEIVALFGLVIIFIYTLYFSDNRHELLIFISLFVAAAYKIMPTMNKILNHFMNIKESQYTIEILIETLNLKVQESSFVREVVRPMDFNSTIEFKNITFNYPATDKIILNDLSFKVNKGDIIGIFGRSGSGKSTLMKVLLRFFIESKGQILIDDVPLTDENIMNWRVLLGYVKQDPYILDVSLKENIAFGDKDEEIDENKLQHAIKAAALDSVIKELPQGIHTVMGEFGDKFSGGQKQRIEIARALYRDAQILILDEATSALDIHTEKEIIESISLLGKEGRTIFVIAHRISTLRVCNKILELENGQFTKSYSYPELVAKEINK